MRFPDLPTRTRECRRDSSAPRFVTSDDQCPAPKRAVSASAAAFWSAAMMATSASVASRNLIYLEETDLASHRFDKLRGVVPDTLLEHDPNVSHIGDTR